MSNRKKTKLELFVRRPAKRRCPKCKSSMAGKEYSDAWLYVCRGCSFPIRVMKDKS